ncbi:virulence RhuM family protein [Mesorhizobium sp. B2-4-18]|uniref:RhuM family protein n=1 Tax=Mesorhizobium sp. B2-4-18 TaxID=2589931 RepID=UPI00112CD1C7|nr:RhuM family protein [Mesorhizobium sp. B2-4-18]TPK80699.1 virulence RhuM family protein [Mesorhizobium sp. B2-4-18]
MATPPKKTIAQKTQEAAKQLELELVQFKLGKIAISFNLDVDHETVWATANQIADLFERDADTVGHHIKSIYAEGELSEAATTAKFAVVQKEGTREVTREITHYDLDVILGVGFRVKSPRASEFRKWAMSTLKAYVVDGYAINEAGLRDNPNALRKLAARIRELRADEKNVYESVRLVFKEASSDYEANSDPCKRFYSMLQDKFHYAVHQNTAAGLILTRASHKKPNMGVVSFGGNMPTVQEAQVGKNYLDHDELYVLHILCEQFLLYAESSAIRGRTLTMQELGSKLDSLLAVNEYPVFKGYKAALHKKAVEHAQAEYAMWQRRLVKEETGKLTKA